MPQPKRMLTETERAAIKAALSNHHQLSEVMDEIIAVKESCYSCEHYHDNFCQLHEQTVPQYERNKHHECFNIRREDPF